MLAGLCIHFVRVVGGKYVGLIAGDAHRFHDTQLFALAADEDAAFVDVAANIVDDLLAFFEFKKAPARVELHMGSPRTGESFYAGQKPGASGFHESDAQAWKLIEDAVEDDARETDHLTHRMTESVGHHVRTHVIHQKIFV